MATVEVVTSSFVTLSGTLTLEFKLFAGGFAFCATCVVIDLLPRGTLTDEIDGALPFVGYIVPDAPAPPISQQATMTEVIHIKAGCNKRQQTTMYLIQVAIYAPLQPANSPAIGKATGPTQIVRPISH